MAVLDWGTAVDAVESCHLAPSPGEAGVLRAEATLAVGAPVGLRRECATLDDRNARVLATAVTTAAGAASYVPNAASPAVGLSANKLESGANVTQNHRVCDLRHFRLIAPEKSISIGR